MPHLRGRLGFNHIMYFPFNILFPCCASCVYALNSCRTPRLETEPLSVDRRTGSVAKRLVSVTVVPTGRGAGSCFASTPCVSNSSRVPTYSES